MTSPLLTRSARWASCFLSVWILLILGATSVSLWAAEAPSETAEPGEPAAAPVPPKRVEAGVEIRWRNEFRDNADFVPADDFDSFLGQRIRLFLLFRAHSDVTFFVEGQDVWLFGAERDKIIHNTATNLHQLYLDWRPGGSAHWSLRAGRQELIYGKERLVGAFNWDNAGRSFDAARLRHQRGPWTSDFLWGRLVEIRRAGAGHRPGNRDLYGIYLTHAPQGARRRTEVYGLFFHDGLRRRGELAGKLETVDIFTLGFRRQRQPAAGFRYEVENAWQFGERGPDRHRAAAFIASAGYGWGGRWQPAWAFEYAFATGEGNPADGRSREFENLFPTNHLHYGYADLTGLRNIHDFRLTTSSRLHPKLTLQADYHRFLLANPRGPWKNAGGRILGFDPTGASGRDLGQEVDLTVRLPLSKMVSLLAGYSVFLPGRFAIQARGPETHQFAYVQTVFRFPAK